MMCIYMRAIVTHEERCSCYYWTTGAVFELHVIVYMEDRSISISLLPDTRYFPAESHRRLLPRYSRLLTSYLNTIATPLEDQKHSL